MAWVVYSAMANSSSPIKLLIGSTNPGKVGEIVSLLRGLSIHCISVSELPHLAEIEVHETGSTYAENALLKAKAYGQTAQLLTLAEDSGLEVSALAGFPGIRSDRWLTGTYHEKNMALLAKLDNLGSDIDRSARFVNVTCLYNPSDQSCQFFQGELHGSIAGKPSGQDGFGYDPIFIPTGHTQSLAELGQNIKNQVSARSQSMKQVAQYLQTHFLD